MLVRDNLITLLLTRFKRASALENKVSCLDKRQSTEGFQIRKDYLHFVINLLIIKSVS